MQTRTLGPFQVSAIGLGCMNLSHAYGPAVSAEQAERVLLSALDAGVTLFDTAALYGFGANETLVGRVLKPHRQKFTLASKCGMQGVDVNGDGKLVRVIDGHPKTLRKTCEDSLRRLQTDVIDLYYLHRWDKRVPIEDSVGALGELVQKGDIRSIGLSEVSAATLRRAHAEHPIAALQTEYSLATRNPELAVLDACKELGVSFVAFSPVGRGLLCDTLLDLSALHTTDIRRSMPTRWAARWRSWPLPGCCIGVSTSSPYPAPPACRIWPRTWRRPACHWTQPPWPSWMAWSTSTRCRARATTRRRTAKWIPKTSRTGPAHKKIFPPTVLIFIM
jgi:aryl-alcohol dehydrogenase-like predicted oxidoreductase